jgi:hypothetical protein
MAGTAMAAMTAATANVTTNSMSVNPTATALRPQLSAQQLVVREKDIPPPL